jgi:hypothetical protein
LLEIQIRVDGINDVIAGKLGQATELSAEASCVVDSGTASSEAIEELAFRSVRLAVDAAKLLL